MPGTSGLNEVLRTIHGWEAPGARTLDDLLNATWHSGNPEYWEQDAPLHPTDARPGTCEKVAVMARRHEDGERLWHPDDPTDFPLLARPEDDEEAAAADDERPPGRRRRRNGYQRAKGKVGYW